MFDNIGGKIKTLAKVLCWIGIISSIIGGIVFIAIDEDFIFSGLAIMIVGPLMSWVGSFFMYGFGELIERTASIDEKLSKGSKSTTKESEKITSSADNSENNNPDIAESSFKKSKKGTCELCDAENVKLVECEIVDKMGTRYRKICKDCMEKTNATPLK